VGGNLIFILPYTGCNIKKEDFIALIIGDCNIGYATVINVLNGSVLIDVDKKVSKALISYNKNQNFKLTLS
jgi:ABC-type uncharacterized transport system ATPase component